MRMTIWERIQLGVVLATQKGVVGYIRKCIQMIEKLELTEEEKREINYKEKDGMMLWDRELIVDIELTKKDIEFLIGVINNFQDWPSDRRVLTLVEKFSQEEDKK